MARKGGAIALILVVFSSLSACAGSDPPAGDATGPDPETPPSEPPAVPQDSIVALHTAFNSVCATTSDGRVYCWGENRFGEFGNGTRTSSTVPVPGALSTSTLELGDVNHAARMCGLNAAGTAYCWGYNFFGEAGDGTTETSFSPVAVSTDEKFRKITTTLHSTCGTTADGRGFCWGLKHGPLPVAMPASQSFAKVNAGYRVNCALDLEGIAFCWGAGNMLGLGPDADSTEVPASVSDMTFSVLETAYSLTCGVTTGQEVWCWGVVDGTGGFPWPELMSESDAIIDLSVDGGEICMLREDRATVRCFHPFVDRWTTLTGLPDIAEINAGSQCARTLQGRVWCWHPWDLGTPYQVPIPPTA